MGSKEYEKRGVSSTKEEVHQALAGVSAGIFPSAFCKILPDVAGDGAMASVMHADGAGTKSTVAYLYFRETGDASVFEGIAQDSIVMNIDDLICVGATGGFVVSNTIGRNAQRAGGDVIRAVIRGYDRFAERMRPLGVDLEMAGGETADVGDLVRTIIVDSTVFVRLPRADVVDVGAARPGDVIVGLASSGRARYEDADNSGIGSNGLTLARHVLLGAHYRQHHAETYAETVDPSAIYCGKFRLADRLPDSAETVGWGLLSPTRTYAPVIRACLQARRADISGIIHCSGGGQAKCRRFGQGVHYIKDALFDPPAIFRAIAATGIPASEMYETFNMGHRMELYCRPTAAQALIDISASFGVAAKVVGRIEANGGGENRVTVAAAGVTHEYRFPLV